MTDTAIEFANKVLGWKGAERHCDECDIIHAPGIYESLHPHDLAEVLTYARKWCGENNAFVGLYCLEKQCVGYVTFRSDGEPYRGEAATPSYALMRACIEASHRKEPTP